MAIWSNNYHGQLSDLAYSFNQSIQIDQRLFAADIEGSLAHVKMLGQQGIIPQEEAQALAEELEKIWADYEKGQLEIDMDEEDIHSFTEAELTRRLGDIGKKIHTGRSRNDQVAVDLKIYAKEACTQLMELIQEAIQAFCDKAKLHLTTIMPGYTHLQRAQPITYAHYLMAYAEMLYRDWGRIEDVKKRILATNPLGAGALATSTFPIDRQQTTDTLGFTDFAHNSLDAVSDRDYSIELAGALSILSMHLSRYAEETILWSSQEFQFISLADTFSTGSSIMPQKKNADMHELLRGKAGRVYGNLMAILTVMKGLPLAYDKDMQEEKELLFDSIDQMQQMMALIPSMLEETIVHEDRMYQACGQGFINATDCADYLTAKGVPFRDAYRVTGDLIQYCLEHDQVLESLDLSVYQEFHADFESDIYDYIDLEYVTFNRKVDGGPAPQKVEEHISWMENQFHA